MEHSVLHPPTVIAELRGKWCFARIVAKDPRRLQPLVLEAPDGSLHRARPFDVILPMDLTDDSLSGAS